MRRDGRQLLPLARILHQKTEGNPFFAGELLRALEEKEIVRVGGTRPVPVDVRIISATHKKLGALVDAGEFRQDLYYRLKVVELPVNHRPRVAGETKYGFGIWQRACDRQPGFWATL